MKKTYIQPTTKLHALRTSRMLAGSPNLNEDYGKENGPRLGKEDEEIDFGW